VREVQAVERSSRCCPASESSGSWIEIGPSASHIGVGGDLQSVMWISWSMVVEMEEVMWR
jgi:hypothetical protein